MQRRLDLHELLKETTGVEHLYFQPPDNIQLQYPCIIYNRSYATTETADNIPYRITKRYSITVIDYDPDSELPDRVARIPNARFETHFTKDNLNHDVFQLYF